jgi:hypothetical protein
MLPTVLNLTQLEFGIRKVVKKTLGLDAVIFPQSAENDEKNKDRLGDARASATNDLFNVPMFAVLLGQVRHLDLLKVLDLQLIS